MGDNDHDLRSPLSADIDGGEDDYMYQDDDGDDVHVPPDDDCPDEDVGI